MSKTRRNLLAERRQPQQDLIGCAAGRRHTGRNSCGISGVTNHPAREGCKPTGRTTRESNWSLDTNKQGKATRYCIGEASSVRSRDQSRVDASSGVHGTARWDSYVWEHGRSSLAYPRQADGQDPSYKVTPKGMGSREEVGQGHSSVDGRDSRTRQERRDLTLAAQKLERGKGDCR